MSRDLKEETCHVRIREKNMRGRRDGKWQGPEVRRVGAAEEQTEGQSG